MRDFNLDLQVTQLANRKKHLVTWDLVWPLVFLFIIWPWVKLFRKPVIHNVTFVWFQYFNMLNIHLQCPYLQTMPKSLDFLCVLFFSLCPPGSSSYSNILRTRIKKNYAIFLIDCYQKGTPSIKLDGWLKRSMSLLSHDGCASCEDHPSCFWPSWLCHRSSSVPSPPLGQTSELKVSL